MLVRAEAGGEVKDLCRTFGISEATFNNPNTRFGGLNVLKLKRLREREAENARVKNMDTDLLWNLGGHGSQATASTKSERVGDRVRIQGGLGDL